MKKAKISLIYINKRLLFLAFLMILLLPIIVSQEQMQEKEKFEPMTVIVHYTQWVDKGVTQNTIDDNCPVNVQADGSLLYEYSQKCEDYVLSLNETTIPTTDYRKPIYELKEVECNPDDYSLEAINPCKETTKDVYKINETVFKEYETTQLDYTKDQIINLDLSIDGKYSIGFGTNNFTITSFTLGTCINCTIGVGGVAIANYNEPDTNDIVLLYNFTSNANDSSGYGNEGTITAVHNFSWYEFDTLVHQLDVSDSSTLDTKNITIAFWMRYTTQSATYEDIIVKAGSYKWEVGDMTGTSFQITTAGGSTNNWIASNYFIVDEWHHYAGVFNGTHIINYRDGAVVSGANNPKAHGNPGDIVATASDITIMYESSSKHTNGSLDEYIIYNISLTPAQISTLYNKGLFIQASEGFGNYTSDSNYIGQLVNVTQVTWTYSGGSGTNISLWVATSTDNSTWSWCGEYTSSPATMSCPLGNYSKFQAKMQTTSLNSTPILTSVLFNYGINTAPNVTTPSFLPTIIYNDNDIQCNATPTDSEETTLTVEYWWYNGSTLMLNGNKTGAANNTNTLITTLGNLNTSVNELWNCTVRAYDGVDYSNYFSANIGIKPKRINATANYSTSIGTIANTFYAVNTQGYWGSNESWIDIDDDGTLDTASNYTWHREKMTDANINYIRGTMDLSYIANSDGTFDATTDKTNHQNVNMHKNLVEWAYNNDIKVMYAAAYMPSWLANTSASCSGDTITCPPTNYTRWGELVVDFIDYVAHDGIYNSTIEIDVWNEPDLSTFWMNDMAENNPLRVPPYILLYNHTYDAVKAKYPNMKVGGPVTSDHRWDAPMFINGFLGNFTSKFDFFSYHQYRHGVDASTDYDSLMHTSVTSILSRCTTYSADCSNILIGEWGVNNASIQANDSAKEQLELAYSLSWILNNYPSNFTMIKYELAVNSNYSGGSKHEMVSEPLLEDSLWVSYNITKNFATYHVTGATVYNSTSTDTDIRIVATNKSNNYYITVINGEDDIVNITLIIDGIALTNITDLDTSIVYNFTDSQTNLGNFSSKEIRYFLAESANNAPTFNQSLTAESIFHNVNLHIQLNASDNDGDNLVWGINDTLVTITPNYLNTTANLTDNPNIYDSGNYTLQVNVSDGTTTKHMNFTYEIKNRAPTISSVKINSTLGTNYTNQNWTIHFTQADSDSDTMVNTTWFNTSTKKAVLVMDFNNNESTTTEDLSGYGNDGTITNAIWTSGGYSGGGYEFVSASSEYIQISNDYTLNSSSSITLCAWIKPYDLTGTNTIISKVNTGTSSVEYMLRTSGTSLQGFMSPDGTTGNAVYPSSTKTLSKNVWAHVCTTFNGSIIKLFINGEQDATTGSMASLHSDNEPVKIGRRFNGDYWNGSIDEVRIYNYSLSAEQVKLLNDSKSHILHSDETTEGETWTGHVYSSDSQDYSLESTYLFTILNNAPSWNETITDISTFHNVNLVAKFNVTDLDGDTLTWDDNTTLWQIDESGNVNDNPTISESGNYSIQINVTDNSTSLSMNFTYEIKNREPTFDEVLGNASLFHNINLAYQVNATDLDSDTINYTVNTSMVLIDSSGLITDNALQNEAGNYSIKVTINDTLASNTNIFTYEIKNRAPICALVSASPSDLNASSYGCYDILINCTDADGDTINTSRLLMTRTIEGWQSLGIPNYWSIRPPPNNKAEQDGYIQILRADGRGEGKWYDSYGLFNDNFTYSATDNTSVHLTYTTGSDWVLLNWSFEIEPSLFRQSFFLSRGKMEKETKKTYSVYKNNPLLVKQYNLEFMRGAENWTTHGFININYTLTPTKDISLYFCNSSYNVTGSTSPKDDGTNCAYLNSWGTAEIDNKAYTSRNSTYIKMTMSVTNAKIAGIAITNETYMYLTSDTTPSNKDWKIAYVNGSSGTNVSFASSNVSWYSTNDGDTWVQCAGSICGTPDIWHASSKDGDTVQIGVYAEDGAGNYTNFSLYEDDLGNRSDVNYPITSPTIRHYCQGSGETCSDGEDWDLNGTYYDTMAIHIGTSKDPNNVGIVNHTLYLCNVDGSINITINGTFYSSDDSDLHIDWNTTAVSDGLYKMNVTATSDDDNEYKSYLTEFNLTIDNNDAPTFNESLTSESIFHNINLHIQLNASDADGDNLIWAVNDTLVSITNNPPLNTTANLTDNPTQAEAGNYTLQVNITDGTTTLHMNFTYEIKNRAPLNNFTTQITPAIAYTNDTLILSNTSGVYDADGDAITFTYKWYNDSGVISGQTTINITSAYFSKGHNITAEMNASDGSASALVNASRTISNSNITSPIPDKPLNYTHIASDPVWLYWNASSDEDNDTINYYVYGSTSTNPTTLVYATNTSVRYSWSNFVGGTRYYWKVRASDGSSNATSSIYSFNYSQEATSGVDSTSSSSSSSSTQQQEDTTVAEDQDLTDVTDTEFNKTILKGVAIAAGALSLIILSVVIVANATKPKMPKNFKKYIKKKKEKTKV